MPYLLLCLFALLWLFPQADLPLYSAAAEEVDVQEWAVPWENSRPRDPYVGPEGRVWFVGQRGNYVAYLDPASGEFKRYELEEQTLPHNLIVAGDGAVWYAGNGNGHIGKLDPETGATTKYPMPDPAARDPHTLVFTSTGDLWFTVQGGNFIGKLDPESGKVDLVPVRTSRARPYGIKVDANDRPWVVLFGTNKVATVDPETMTLEEIALPDEATRPRRIELDANGHLWYADYSRGYLGQLDLDTHEVKEWPMPGGEQSQPYGTAIDDRGRIWLAEAGVDPNRLVGFDPATGTFFSSTAIPSGGGTIRHMYYHAPTREIWFGTDTNTIGRARVP